MATNIFADPTKSIPKGDAQIVRVSFQENELGGRKDHMPKHESNASMSVQHVNTSKK